MTAPSAIVDFALLPDRGAARRARRLIASAETRLGVVAGTWSELVDLALHTRPGATQPRESWDDALGDALAGVGGAFWSQSLAVAPHETARAVGAALASVLAAGPPGLRRVEAPRLGGRAGERLADLARLAAALDGVLPPRLAALAALLEAPADQHLARLRVAAGAEPALDRWERALLERLAGEAGPGVPALGAVVEEVLHGGGAPAGTQLGMLQSRLFEPDLPVQDVPARDATVQLLGVRDWLEEAEIAAGMVQRLLETGEVASEREIGLLLPDEPAYAAAVADAFGHAGLTVSGLAEEATRRDLGRELVHSLALCLRGPPPAIALADVLASPLAPWSAAEGSAHAQRVMRGDYGLRPREETGPAGRALLALLREGAADAAALDRALEAACALVVDPGSPHGARAREAIAAARARLAQGGSREGGSRGPVDWLALLEAVAPEPLGEPASVYSLEGVSAFTESRSPWRPVRHLLVLGFSAGRYPARAPGSAVFDQADLDALENAGLVLERPAAVMARRRALLARQLRSATASVSFLVPRRDGLGRPLAPSETIIFAARVLGTDPGDDPVLDLDRAAARDRARHLARAAGAPARPPRALRGRDVELSRDLVVALGRGRPESPSGLDRLMVSPLAWLLRRLRAEPRPWTPEALDPALLGVLAHDVLETLFTPGAPLPAPDTLREAVPGALGAAVRVHAAFLASPRWRIERRHLVSELTAAALVWREALAALGAEVVATEVALAGRLGDLQVHGHADAILALPDRTLMIVDYKKASSGARRERMEAGFDSQVSLYRTMLETGGPEGAEPCLLDRLATAHGIGVLYAMLNDAGLLADREVPGASALPGWAVVASDVSGAAMRLIGERLAAVRAGRIELNRAGDEDWFLGTAKVRPYALDDSPLVRLFLVPDEPGAP